MKRIAYGLLFVLIMAGLGQIAWQLPQLPDQVASHFNGAGQPDGYMSRNVFAVFMLSMVIGLPVFMVAMGKLTRWLPTGMINMPNREYWLAEARRETTLNEMEGFFGLDCRRDASLLLGAFAPNFCCEHRKAGFVSPLDVDADCWVFAVRFQWLWLHFLEVPFAEII